LPSQARVAVAAPATQGRERQINTAKTLNSLKIRRPANSDLFVVDLCFWQCFENPMGAAVFGCDEVPRTLQGVTRFVLGGNVQYEDRSKTYMK
jgi:hypothetical protein